MKSKSKKENADNGKHLVEKPHEFDRIKILNNENHSDYNINYLLFKNTDPDNLDLSFKKISTSGIGKYLVNENKSCFAGLKRMVSTFKKAKKEDPNTVVYFCNHKSNRKTENHLTDEEIGQWVSLCTWNKLMPEYIGSHFVETKNFVLRLDDLSLQKVYVYLLAARFIQEEPYFIKSILYMVNDLGFGLLTAFAIASVLCINNSGHHILPISRSYGPADVNKRDGFDLTYSIKLVKYLCNDSRHKTSIISDENPALYFNLHSAIKQTKCKTFIVLKEDLFENPSSIEEKLLSEVGRK